MSKYLRVMDGTKSNESGLETPINEVIISRDWCSNASNSNEIKGINISNEENILRWIIRGSVLYEVTLPNDAEIINVPSKTTPNGVFRVNKLILNNPVPLTENVVMNLYEKSKMPEKTYYSTLAILAIKNYPNVCDRLIKERVNKNNINQVLEEYESFSKKSNDNSNVGLYYVIKDKLLKIKNE